jgi:hypothetical protein
MPLKTDKMPILGAMPPKISAFVEGNDGLVKLLLVAVSIAAILGGIYLWTVPNSITVGSFYYSLVFAFSYGIDRIRGDESYLLAPKGCH